jgi:hypothetical protein
MRATKAYIASAGTAAVMLAASIGLFALVSTFVAFGSWPGSNTATQVNKVVLSDVAAPKKATPVRVRSDAVTVGKRAAAHRQVAVAPTRTRSHSTKPGGAKQGGDSVPAGTPVAQAPTPTSGAPSPGAPVSQQVQNTTQQVQQTTRQTTQTLQDTTNKVTAPVTQQVQDTTQQVNQVVDQVVGGVQTGTTDAVNQVSNTAGSLIGH